MRLGSITDADADASFFGRNLVVLVKCAGMTLLAGATPRRDVEKCWQRGRLFLKLPNDGVANLGRRVRR